MVSFVVIAYQQETQVRAAIEAAFAQTYSPLEIILSDDGSTDGTFSIMEEMANAYNGPHTVRLNQNKKNLGLIGHVNLLFEMASGTLIIPAAGDDISLPNRAEVLFNAFRETRPYLIDTPIISIDAQGNVQGEPHSRINEVADHTTEKASYTLNSIIGASSAWSKEMHDLYGPITEAGTYEDAIFYFRARLAGRFLHVAEPLVQYRSNGMSWQKGDVHSIRLKKARLRVATWRQRRKDMRTFCEHIERTLCDAEVTGSRFVTHLEHKLPGNPPKISGVQK